MTEYNVYYMALSRPKYRETCSIDLYPGVIMDMHDTHVLVKTIKASNLESAFHNMQGEIWSPNGEANEHIRAIGAGHTSMMVGDVFQDLNTHNFFMVDSFGFKKLGVFKNGI